MKMNQILQGHASDVLKGLSSRSIDCCVTSPPYWGLRDYGLKPQIWDGDKNCDHQWGKKRKTLSHKSGETNPGKEGWYKDKGASDDKGSQFCAKCGAWCGSLGLEPNFNLYIKHLCDIFDEVKRVLKKEGSCWVNIGDTYAANRTYQIDGTKQIKGSQPIKQPQAKDSDIFEKSLCLIPFRFSIEMCNRGWIFRNTIIWYKPNCMPSSVKDRFTVDFEFFFFLRNLKNIISNNNLKTYRGK